MRPVIELLPATLLQVYDLQYASPATISRCGMVYVDPKDLGYEPYWQKWVNERMNMVEREELIKLFKKFVPGCIDLVCEGIRDGRQTEKLKTIVPLTSLNMASNSASLPPSLRISTTSSLFNLPLHLWLPSLDHQHHPRYV